MTKKNSLPASLQPDAPLPMVRGTTGRRDYLCIARNGNVGLSFKFYPIVPGEAVQMPGTVYCMVRIRVADVARYLDGVDSMSTLDENALDAAFPGIPWSNRHDSRLSMGSGVFMRGDLAENPSIYKEFIGDHPGSVARKLMAYLKTLAGNVPMLVSEQQLFDYIDNWYTTKFEKLAASLNGQKEFEQAAKAIVNELPIGEFGDHDNVLAKLQQKLHGMKPSLPKMVDEEEDGEEYGDEGHVDPNAD